MRGIESKLDDLGRDPRHAELAGSLRETLVRFDFDRYRAVLHALGPEDVVR